MRAHRLTDSDNILVNASISVENTRYLFDGISFANHACAWDTKSIAMPTHAKPFHNDLLIYKMNRDPWLKELSYPREVEIILHDTRSRDASGNKCQS